MCEKESLGHLKKGEIPRVMCSILSRGRKEHWKRLERQDSIHTVPGRLW